MGNLSGHPSVAVPSGFDSNGLPTSIMFQSKWFDEIQLLLVANQIPFSPKKPQIFYSN